MAISGVVSFVFRLPRPAAVRVSVLPSFAALWLVPRLAAFRALHPDIEVALDPTLNAADFAADGVDLAIRYGDGHSPGAQADRLMAERLTPVRAPHADPDGPLLMTRKAFDWTTWAQAAGFDLAARPQLQLTDYNVVLQAALRGEGLALGRLNLVDPLVASDQLITPFETIACADQAAYWLVRPPGRALPPAARAFADWIADAAR